MRPRERHEVQAEGVGLSQRGQSAARRQNPLEILKDLSEGYQSGAGKQVDWGCWRGTRKGKREKRVRGCWFQVSETERCNKGIHAIVQPGEDGLNARDGE